jgi:cytochrome o ubiquinol oxidase operon protein cyoD
MTTHSPAQDEQATATRYGTGAKTLKSYLLGLFLCLILTFTAFGLVIYHILPAVQLYIVLAVLAVTQLFVQIICFLRLNTTKEGLWNSMSFFFAIVIVVILVSGTLWIMYNLDYYMMH